MFEMPAHVNQLVKEVEAGDDSVLGILADAYEDIGYGSNADLIRSVIESGFRPARGVGPSAGTYFWFQDTGHPSTDRTHALPPEVFRLLWHKKDSHTAKYESRLNAYYDLYYSMVESRLPK